MFYGSVSWDFGVADRDWALLGCGFFLGLFSWVFYGAVFSWGHGVFPPFFLFCPFFSFLFLGAQGF